jgi:hypothetical protein
VSRVNPTHIPSVPGTVSRIKVEDILAGDIAILPELLQQTNLIDEFRATAIAVICDEVSPSIARDVSKKGFERLHECVPPYFLPELITSMATRLQPVTVRLFRRMIPFFESRPARLFLAGQTWVRIMMPEDHLTDYKDTLAHLNGHAVVHNPHRDSWFSQAIDSVNVWIALGRVSRDNSILIYPTVLGKKLKREGHCVAKSQPIGVPLSFDLNPGDALLFSGEHLHSSAVNVSAETRLVVSLRFTTQPPSYLNREKQTTYFEV